MGSGAFLSGKYIHFVYGNRNEGVSLFKPSSAMTDQDFVPGRYDKEYMDGLTAWEAPSNIALIKYWGKKEPQLPANPSLSLTLSKAVSRTVLTYQRREGRPTGFSFDI